MKLEPDDPIAELRRDYQSLRTLFQFTTLCGIVLSSTLFVLVLKQHKVIRRQNVDLTNYVNEYNKNFVPQVENVRTNLTEYARTHPAINPLVQKYFSTNAGPARPTP